MPASEGVREDSAIATQLALPTTEFVSLLAEAAGQAPEGPAGMPSIPGMPGKPDMAAAGTTLMIAGTTSAPPSTEPAQLAPPATVTGVSQVLPASTAAKDEPAAATAVPSPAAPPQHPGAAELPAATPPLPPNPVQTPLTTQIQTSHHTPAMAPGRAVPPELVPITIASLASTGERRFDIRLDPADLGRIEVTLSVDAEGGVRTHLVVERPETLTLLRKDLPRLEQALDATGLKSDPSGISLGLRNGGQGHDAHARPDAAPVNPAHSENPGSEQAPPAYRQPRPLPGSAGRLDLIA
ncbi:MAG TPA: flagellar hook-length control protein FliK [Beijerinckiaceae bacterium]|nr:flagellar hook-length control protein FliK [Beijerinckiaceae bacterium]